MECAYLLNHLPLHHHSCAIDRINYVRVTVPRSQLVIWPLMPQPATIAKPIIPTHSCHINHVGAIRKHIHCTNNPHLGLAHSEACHFSKKITCLAMSETEVGIVGAV